MGLQSRPAYGAPKRMQGVVGQKRIVSLAAKPTCALSRPRQEHEVLGEGRTLKRVGAERQE